MLRCDIPNDLWEMENFANAYRNWLVYTMGGERHRILFDILYDEEFCWTIPEDENRASAGRYLRELFESETGLRCDDAWTEWPCSFLEMVVALAYSMESILYDPSDDRTHAAHWFWSILHNLGLDELTDDAMLGSPNSSYRYISAVCNQVCNRKFDRNGEGGLFPLRNSKDDQRHVEIWDQMQSYILENGF